MCSTLQVGPSTVRYQVFCICPFCCFYNFSVFMNRKKKKRKKLQEMLHLIKTSSAKSDEIFVK